MSHTPAFSVLRKKPRRCAHHVYSTRSPRSWANSSAILFSKPSPRLFEKGRLFGSAQTRSTPAGRAITGWAIASAAGRAGRVQAERVSKQTTNKTSLRKRKNIKHASLRRVVRQIRHRTDKPERARRVACIETACDDCARPTTNTREYRDVLLAVRSTITNRLPDDSRATFELPQQRAALRIERLEPTVHRAVKNHVARRYERAAPYRKVFRHAPNPFVLHRIPCEKLAAIAARPGVHAHVHADVRRARDVVCFETLNVLAKV